MDYNYHTHTHRCSHASGTEEEYVKRAVENGIKYMGFSDHVPLRFSDGTESGYRVPVSDAKEYCREIKALAEKYKDKIDIKVGFEMEYYPEYFDKTIESVVEYGAEYLILGQHYTAPENIVVNQTISETDSVEDLCKYTSLVVSAMKTGVYTYVAHPDIFNFTGDVSLYKDEMRKICVASRELNVPLEINFLGIRDNRIYPKDLFWQIAGEEKSPVVFGFDAHDVLSAFDGDSLEEANALVEKYGLNYIGKPDLALPEKNKRL